MPLCVPAFAHCPVSSQICITAVEDDTRLVRRRSRSPPLNSGDEDATEGDDRFGPSLAGKYASLGDWSVYEDVEPIKEQLPY